MEQITDRDLLEMAAKAAGEVPPSYYGNANYLDGVLQRWNPLADDGDALRLAVSLGIYMQSDCSDEYSRTFAACYKYDDCGVEKLSVRQEHDGDPYAATRRAIVRAAAEIGKEMDENI